MKNQNQKSSKGVMLTEAQWERCDRLANEMGCRSRNAFIRDAIDFYCSWLEKEQSERFLTPALYIIRAVFASLFRMTYPGVTRCGHA